MDAMPPPPNPVSHSHMLGAWGPPAATSLATSAAAVSRRVAGTGALFKGPLQRTAQSCSDLLLDLRGSCQPVSGPLPISQLTPKLTGCSRYNRAQEARCRPLRGHQRGRHPEAFSPNKPTGLPTSTQRARATALLASPPYLHLEESRQRPAGVGAAREQRRESEVPLTWRHTQVGAGGSCGPGRPLAPCGGLWSWPGARWSAKPGLRGGLPVASWPAPSAAVL